MTDKIKRIKVFLLTFLVKLPILKIEVCNDRTNGTVTGN